MNGLSQVLPRLYRIVLGPVNSYLVEDGEGLVLLDTGYPGHEARILKAVDFIGRRPADLRTVVLTHSHCDHTGSAAAIRSATGAEVVAHSEDAALIESGHTSRPMAPSDGILNGLLFKLFVEPAPQRQDPCPVDRRVSDGDRIVLEDGPPFTVIHAPGHSAGQIALLWPHEGGVLFAADVASHVQGRLRLSIGYEDEGAALATLKRISEFDFAHACFGHGKPMHGRASERFAHKWGAAQPVPAA